MEYSKELLSLKTTTELNIFLNIANRKYDLLLEENQDLVGNQYHDIGESLNPEEDDFDFKIRKDLLNNYASCIEVLTEEIENRFYSLFNF